MYTARKEFVVVIATVVFSNCISVQNFERYRPQTLTSGPVTRPQLQDVPAPVHGSDRVLLDAFNAVIVVDDVSQVDPQNANADAVGLVRRFGDHTSLVHSAAFESVVQQHLNQPVSLRSLNQLSRDIINFYRHNKQPVVDVVIPEQKITGGTVQIVVTESKIGEVIVQGGCYFDPCMVSKWGGCTRQGRRIYDPWIENDLFWLNQNPFRNVGVELKSGAQPGTTHQLLKQDAKRGGQTRSWGQLEVVNIVCAVGGDALSN